MRIELVRLWDIHYSVVNGKSGTVLQQIMEVGNLVKICNLYHLRVFVAFLGDRSSAYFITGLVIGMSTFSFSNGNRCSAKYRVCHSHSQFCPLKRASFFETAWTVAPIFLSRKPYHHYEFMLSQIVEERLRFCGSKSLCTINNVFKLTLNFGVAV